MPSGRGVSCGVGEKLFCSFLSIDQTVSNKCESHSGGEICGKGRGGCYWSRDTTEVGKEAVREVRRGRKRLVR
mgnify:CR=1 FL=1